jgi:hypothetical protein
MRNFQVKKKLSKATLNSLKKSQNSFCSLSFIPSLLQPISSLFFFFFLFSFFFSSKLCFCFLFSSKIQRKSQTKSSKVNHIELDSIEEGRNKVMNLSCRTPVMPWSSHDQDSYLNSGRKEGMSPATTQQYGIAPSSLLSAGRYLTGKQTVKANDNWNVNVVSKKKKKYIF